MAAQEYWKKTSYAQDQQSLLSPNAPQSPLKPLHLVDYHRRNSSSLDSIEEFKQQQLQDAQLKARIRRLRLISRVLAFTISIAVLVPITMTLVKFLTTQNTYRDVINTKGQKVTRTAWAKDTKAWPTWMYFAVAAMSVLLNFITVISYKAGVGQANKANCVATIFTWVVMTGNLIVWSVAAGLYRTEKDKNGKSNDLWGWTCSHAAQAIQKEFAGEVQFDTYCNFQSASFYIGIVQVGAAILTIITYIYIMRRNWSKKTIKRQQSQYRNYTPPHTPRGHRRVVSVGYEPRRTSISMAGYHSRRQSLSMARR